MMKTTSLAPLLLILLPGRKIRSMILISRWWYAYIQLPDRLCSLKLHFRSPGPLAKTHN